MAEKKCKNCKFFDGKICAINGKVTSPIYTCGKFVEG